MNRFGKLAFALVLGLATVVLAPRAARADGGTGYLCYVYDSLGASIYGNYGSVGVALYTAPHCTGSYITGVTFSSTGATACPAWSSVDEARLIAIKQQLVSAVTSSSRVYLGANGYCGVSVFTYSN